ncbi:MAG: pyridoxal phosphate-dependent aminotransferase [Synergistaceae bacterium]|jgi:cystathionine beta-lyase|nr:pyridoxal phosphate-dependent aminotransferase [Synergistaceae bacterium]
MRYNFNRLIDRKNTDSYKWDDTFSNFGKDGVIPLWVADMDFPCAAPILEAIRERMEHPILGYTMRTKGYVEAIIGWFKSRHAVDLKKEWISFSPPGVIYAINTMVHLMTKRGEKIVLQSPNYGPLFDVVKKNGRELSVNPMICTDEGYRIDFDDLEHRLKGTKMLILSSPNNPTGRVWGFEELSRIGEMCLSNGAFVISDEIYSDIVFSDYKHIPFYSVNKEFADNSMACYSTNKTFNLGGLQMGTVIIPNPIVKARYDEVMNIAQTRLDNLFGAIALEAAYTKGHDWLTQVIRYIEDNRKFVEDYLKRNIPAMKLINGEGTFLLWIDCRGLNLTQHEIEDFFIQKASVALTQGHEFGENGASFVRMNIACPRKILKQALNAIKQALQAIN